jgi:hypothetical protein
MTPREAFELGFLRRCAEAGLSAEQTEALVKTAMIKAADPFSLAAMLGSKGMSMLGNVGGLALGLGLLAPPAAGYLAGRVASKATEPEIDVEDLKKQELIDEYRRLAARARASLAIRKRREQTS